RVELAFLDEPIELLLDLRDALLREVRRRIDDDDIDAGLRRDLSNALPHLAGANDAELLHVHYARSTSNAMPSPPPIHSDAPPVLTFLSAIAWTSVTSRRAPDAPI